MPDTINIDVIENPDLISVNVVESGSVAIDVSPVGDSVAVDVVDIIDDISINATVQDQVDIYVFGGSEGGTVTFVQDAEPLVAREGDLWRHRTSGAFYVYVSGTWQPQIVDGQYF